VLSCSYVSTLEQTFGVPEIPDKVTSEFHTTNRRAALHQLQVFSALKQLYADESTASVQIQNLTKRLYNKNDVARSTRINHPTGHSEPLVFAASYTKN